jgi:hypothetical protein
MSQSEVNKTVRVLTSSRLAHTVTIIKKSGERFEMQCGEKLPKLDYQNESRTVILIGQFGDDYGKSYPICNWDDVEVVTVEKNP